MLRRQGEQSNLIQQLLGMLNDETALDLMLTRHENLIDGDLFVMLEQMMMMMGNQGQEQAAAALGQLHVQLVEKTPAGDESSSASRRCAAYSISYRKVARERIC